MAEIASSHADGCLPPRSPYGPRAMKKQWALVWILSGLAMLGAFSIDAYLPSFHAIELDLHVDRVAVQWTLSIYLCTFALMMLFYGTLSDTFGRRPVILTAVAGYVLGSIGAMCAPSFGWLLAFRGVQGLSAGAGSVVGQAVIRDLHPGQMGQRIMSYVSMVFSLAPAIAPVVGGELQVWFGWRSVFAFLSLASLAMWLAAWRILPESLPSAKRVPLHLGTILKGYRQVASHGDFMLQAFGSGLRFAGFSLYISTGSDFVMNVLHRPETEFAWLFIPIIIGMSTGSALSARLAMKYPPARLVWISYIVMAVAMVANLLYANLCVPSVPWAVLPGMVYMFGLALGTPAMTLRTMDLFPEAKGMAASLQGFIQMLLFAGMSVIVAPFVLGDIRKLALAVAGGWGLSIVLWWIGTRRPLVPHHDVVEEEILGVPPS